MRNPSAAGLYSGGDFSSLIPDRDAFLHPGGKINCCLKYRPLPCHPQKTTTLWRQRAACREGYLGEGGFVPGQKGKETDRAGKVQPQRLP